MTFDKGTQEINRGRIVFSQNGAGTIEHSKKERKKKESQPILHIMYKNTQNR